jgi:predicted nuclease of predicted toxin-antitoxin system
VSEPVRFYFDQHIPFAVARGLRRRGVDVLTAQEADRCGLPDLGQLEYAFTLDRVLVTFDADLLVLSAGGVEHKGIAFCTASKHSIGELIYALLLVQDVMTQEDMLNHVEFI